MPLIEQGLSFEIVLNSFALAQGFLSSQAVTVVSGVCISEFFL